MCSAPPPPPRVTFRRVVVSLRGPGQSPAAAGAPASVSAFAEPSSWCAGAVLNVAGCAVCASAAPSSWRTGGCAGCCGGRLTVFAVPTHLRPQAVHNLPRCVSMCVRPRCPVPPGVVPAVHHRRSPTPWVARAQGAFLVPPPLSTLFQRPERFLAHNSVTSAVRLPPTPPPAQPHCGPWRTPSRGTGAGGT